MKAFSKIKIIAGLAAVFMLTACFAAFADTPTGTVYTEEAFWYTIGSDDSITITGCFDTADVINVPSVIAGKPVNHIAVGAFVDCPASVINLPDTIMDVEEGAFRPEATVNWRVNASDQIGGNDDLNEAPGRPGINGNASDDHEFYDNGMGPGSAQNGTPSENNAAEGNAPEGGAAIEVNLDEDALENNKPDYMKADSKTTGDGKSGSGSTGNGASGNGNNANGNSDNSAQVGDASGNKTDSANGDGDKTGGSANGDGSISETDAGAIDFVDGPGMVKETKSNTGMILGIIAGIALLAWILWFFFIKRKKKDEKEEDKKA